MRGSPKTTQGRGAAFFARSVIGSSPTGFTYRKDAGNNSLSNPPSLKTEIQQASARKATPADTVAGGIFGRPSGTTGASAPSLLNGQAKGIGSRGTAYTGDYQTTHARGPYGKVRVR